MKETIYTIPINEALDQKTECPFCYLLNTLEKEAIDYTLGAAMMEPDYRILCNEKGFCNRHATMLFKKPNKLSLALILDSRLEKLLSDFSPKKAEKKSRFKKQPKQESQKESCIICEKIENTLNRYSEVFFYMWKKDSDLKEKVLSSKGFCLPHYNFLCEKAGMYLSNPDDFLIPVYELQKKELQRIKDEVHHFTLKFDYRNKDLPWGNSQDAPKRALEKLSSIIPEFEEE